MKKKNDLLNLEKTKLPDELFRLKYELNGLKNTLVDSYATETDNHAGNQDSVTHYSIENTSCPKKGVTFSLITKINLFSENFGSSLSLDIEERGVVPQL
ncbi:hypothetical protein BEV13_03305 [Rickettsiella grylli]|nr:hypothetical protein BEV13_03305 [Rickettsiella grylli]